MENKLFKSAVSKTKMVFLDRDDKKVSITVSVDTHRNCPTQVLESLEQQLKNIRIPNYTKEEKDE